MAKITAKVGESRLSMIRRAQPGDTLVFGNECLEKPHHCFESNKGHNCFSCCYCNLPNGTDQQFQDQVAEDFKRVYGDKFVILTPKPDYQIPNNILKAYRKKIIKWIERNTEYEQGMRIIYPQDLIDFLNK